MVKDRDFEQACLNLRKQYILKTYKLRGKNPDPSHWLKLRYQKIAKRYFPYDVYHSRTLFPGEIVQGLAKELDVYVTDLIRF